MNNALFSVGNGKKFKTAKILTNFYIFQPRAWRVRTYLGVIKLGDYPFSKLKIWLSSEISWTELQRPISQGGDTSFCLLLHSQYSYGWKFLQKKFLLNLRGVILVFINDPQLISWSWRHCNFEILRDRKCGWTMFFFKKCGKVLNRVVKSICQSPLLRSPVLWEMNDGWAMLDNDISQFWQVYTSHFPVWEDFQSLLKEFYNF